MKILKYIILALFLLNLPGFINVKLSAGLGSVLSYASFLSLAFYYIHYLKGKPNFWLFYAGLAYFIISMLNSYLNIPLSNYIILVSKYLIVVIFGNSFFKSVTKKEMVIVLLIGASSIIINATLFPDKYGRYSGFYLNPNAAGYIAIVGYAITYVIKNKKFQNLLKISFTIAGFLTFSRTFILVWLLMNIISLRINIKNIKVIGVGVLLAVMLLTFGELFNLNGQRFKQYQAVFNNKSSAKTLEKGGRSETWAIFYDELTKYPFFGGGYGKLSGNGIYGMGPHNTFILILGEAGIIALLIFVSMFCYMLFWSNKLFSLDPSLLMLTIALILYLMASHTFYSEYIKLCITIYILVTIESLKEEKSKSRHSINRIAHNNKKTGVEL